MTEIVLAEDPDLAGSSMDRLRALSEHANRKVAIVALQYLGHRLENQGDPDATLEVIDRAMALWRDEDGPWARAMLECRLAQTYAQLGRYQEAARHAELAMPVLDELEVGDDAMQVRSVMAAAAIERGDVAEAERLFEETLELQRRRPAFGGGVMTLAGRAELSLAKGDVEEGLRFYREVSQRMEELRFPGMIPTGYEPWTLFGISAAVTAYALHGTGDDGADLVEELVAKAPTGFDPDYTFLDYPVAGMVLFALGIWGLTRGRVPAPDAVRLLVLADRFGYNRFVPTFAWPPAAARAEAAAPGLVDELLAEYGTRRGPDLILEARALVLRSYGS
jgi:tetratricopeptide (TPR) repeat protein